MHPTLSRGESYASHMMTPMGSTNMGDLETQSELTPKRRAAKVKEEEHRQRRRKEAQDPD